MRFGRLLRTGLVVLILLYMTGCERDRPSPGVLEATVEGPAGPFAAAVLEVAGEGVKEVKPAAGTRVWTREMEPERIRFVVIQPGEGPLSFGVRVADRSGPAPTFTIVELADANDENVLPTGDDRIRIRR